MLLVVALKNIDVMGADVQNAYLNIPNRENHWIKAGPEFCQHEGKYYIVAKALYGLKSIGASFRLFMAKILNNLGFRSCIADPYVWRRPAVKKDKTEYYEYIRTYVDDSIVVSEKTKRIPQQVVDIVKLKNDEIEAPQSNLGAKLRYKIIDDISRWTVSSEDYVNAAINTVEESLKKNPMRKLKKIDTPMIRAYSAELDGTSELNTDDINSSKSSLVCYGGQPN